MNSVAKDIVIIVIGAAILTAIQLSIWLVFNNKPASTIAQIVPECPEGLTEAAAQKKYDYDQSQAEQAAFQAMRKGPQ